jgi:hypothetical protein
LPQEFDGKSRTGMTERVSFQSFVRADSIFAAFYYYGAAFSGPTRKCAALHSGAFLRAGIYNKR